MLEFEVYYSKFGDKWKERGNILTGVVDELKNMKKKVCLFVTEATHWFVKTGSKQGSYANPL